MRASNLPIKAEQIFKRPRSFVPFRVAMLLLATGLCQDVVTAAPPVLLGPTVIQGQFRFILSGETNVTYTIETSADLVTWTAVGMNSDSAAQRLTVVPATNTGAFLRVRESKPLFSNALAVRRSIDLNGSNLRTDSFDSADPAYSTDGYYDPLKIKDNAHIAAYLGILNSVNVGNVEVYGHIYTGPGAAVFLGPLGSVGDIAWHQSNATGVEPGYVSDDMSLEFPEVVLPMGGYFNPAPGVVHGRSYDYVLGGSVNYQLTSLSMSSQRMIVTGDAVLYVTSNFNLSGTASIEIAVGARLRLYVGGLAVIGGSGIINSNRAPSFIFYGLPTSTMLSVTGNSLFAGGIYAPNTDVSFESGGNNTQDFVGAVVARSARINGHYQFHFDENLKEAGPLF